MVVRDSACTTRASDGPRLDLRVEDDLDVDEPPRIAVDQVLVQTSLDVLDDAVGEHLVSFSVTGSA